MPLFKVDFQATPHAPKVRQLVRFNSWGECKQAAAMMSTDGRVVTCAGPNRGGEQ